MITIPAGGGYNKHTRTRTQRSTLAVTKLPGWKLHIPRALRSVLSSRVLEQRWRCPGHTGQNTSSSERSANVPCEQCGWVFASRTVPPDLEQAVLQDHYHTVIIIAFKWVNKAIIICYCYYYFQFFQFFVQMTKSAKVTPRVMPEVQKLGTWKVLNQDIFRHSSSHLNKSTEGNIWIIILIISPHDVSFRSH